jgi:hypothetical protein
MSEVASDADRLIENLRLTGAPDPERFRDFVTKWLSHASELDRQIAVAHYDRAEDGATIKVDYQWEPVFSDRSPWVGMSSPYFGVRTVFEG